MTSDKKFNLLENLWFFAEASYSLEIFKVKFLFLNKFVNYVFICDLWNLLI